MTKKEELAKSVEMMTRMKADVRDLINKYSVETATLANTKDHISPVVTSLQMALANAALDHAVFCGLPPVDALQGVINLTGSSMKVWIDTVIKLHKLHAKTTTDTVEVKNDKKIILN